MEDSNLKKTRLDKLKKIQELGINPYPAVANRTHTIYDALKSEGKTVSAVGRIFSFREHGNIIFADLKDDTGKIQIFLQKKLLGDFEYKNLKLLDIGDFIEVEGEVVKTVAGEISIAPKRYKLLTKSLNPLPSEWFGLKDIETRLRKRYLDLILNEEIKNIFIKKALFWQSIRHYLIEKGFLEVETPALELIPGGADAKPFITHHNALDIDLYLRISLELYQKRLLVGGYEKVFEIGRIFRNEGIDAEHLQDYTQMEFYWAYADYNDLMDFLEDMYKAVIKKTFGTLEITSHGHTVDWGKKWQKLDYFESFKNATGLEIEKATVKDLENKAKELKIPFEENLGKGRLIDLLYKKTVRSFVIEPTFLIHHPVEVSPLAKRHPENLSKTQRLQILAYGSELGNGFSELNDPIDQRKRFEEQANLREKGDEEAQMMDLDFVEALEYGMPPAAGFGLSERVFSYLVDLPARETVFFPTLRPEEGRKKNNNKITNFNNKEIFSIDQKVKEKFPSVSIGIALIKGVEVKSKSEDLEKEKEEILESFSDLLTEEIVKFPEIISYRMLYKETGVDWHSRRPSPEALLRRIVLKKGLYTVNTCVDAANLVVLKNRVSIGVFNFDKIEFPTVLRLAKTDEKIHLLGDDQITKYKKGEIAYFDQKGGYNIDFNYRDSQRTKVDNSSKNIYINVDGVFEISPLKVEEVLKEACNYIIKYCGGKIEFFGVETA